MRRARIAVIGGGPTGLRAASAAASAGIPTALFDEQPALGGQLRYRVAEIDAGPARGRLRPSALLAALVDEARASGVELHPGATVWGLFEGSELAITEGETTYALQAERIILATGSTDLALPVVGATLPGVFTARAIQLLLNLYRVLPGRRFAVLGGGLEAAEVAADIQLAGGSVVVTCDPGGQLDRVTIAGTGGVEHIICDGQEHAVDVVAIAAGRQPDAQLALMAGCEVTFDVARGGFVPTVGPDWQTSEPRLYVAGDAAGVCDVAVALSEGHLAGLGAAAALTPPLRGDCSLPTSLDPREEHLPMLGEGTEKPPSPKCGGGGLGGEGGTAGHVCRCEEVTAAEILHAIAAGARSINDVKRRTRAGMGICQGIFCNRLVADMIAGATGQPPAAMEPMTARPPVRLIPIGDLAALDEG